MCIRRERGKCVGCFSAAAGDFDVSGIGIDEAAIGHFTVAGGCCGYFTQDAITNVATAATVALNGYGNALGAQFGWDCIIIPGAYFSTTADEGTTQTTQTTALMQQVIGIATTGAIITGTMNAPSGPQICGTGAGIGPGVVTLSSMTQTNAIAVLMATGQPAATGLTVCTRNVPFTLEFMSDDIEGIGTTDTEFGTAANTYNQGFNIQHTQLAC
jgi:hypothetical protein